MFENIISFSLFFNVYLFVFERERERERIQVVEGRERRGERIPSRLCPMSAEPDVGLEPTDREIMT